MWRARPASLRRPPEASEALVLMLGPWEWCLTAERTTVTSGVSSNILDVTVTVKAPTHACGDETVGALCIERDPQRSTTHPKHPKGRPRCCGCRNAAW